ncbi:MAG: fibronectin type III domain-containing protein [Pseudomonadota bacterium]
MGLFLSKRFLKRLILFAIAAVFVFFMARWAYAQDITLQWDPNTETNLAGYNVYESELGASAGSAWVKIGEVDKNTTEYTAAGRDDFKSYAYQVTAKNDQGRESFVSNVAYIQNVPGAPVNVHITINVN